MPSDMQNTHTNEPVDYGMLCHVLGKLPGTAGPSGLKLRIVCDTICLSCRFPLFMIRLSRHIVLDFSMGYFNLEVGSNDFSVGMAFSGEQYSILVGADSIRHAEIMGGIYGKMPDMPAGYRGLALRNDNILVVDFRE